MTERRRRLVGYLDGEPVIRDEPVDPIAARAEADRLRALLPRSAGATYRRPKVSPRLLDRIDLALFPVVILLVILLVVLAGDPPA